LNGLRGQTDLGRKALFSRFSGAALRAVAVILMIAAPSLFLAGTAADTAQIVTLVCIVSAIFTFTEYNSSSPSIVEFRDSPPFNRKTRRLQHMFSNLLVVAWRKRWTFHIRQCA